MRINKWMESTIGRATSSWGTAVLKVMSDILWAIDNGNLSLLAPLDLSSAFGTVDHEILHCRLEVSYGLQGTALSWFTSYLNGRTWCIRCRASRPNGVGVLASHCYQILCGSDAWSCLATSPGPTSLKIIPVLYKPAYRLPQGTGGGVQVVQDIPG